MVVLIFGCTSTKPSEDLNVPQVDKNTVVPVVEPKPTVPDKNTVVVEEVKPEEKPTNVVDSEITYKFTSFDCASTPSRLACEACKLDKNKKISRVYVDYTNPLDKSQGYITKVTYGENDSVVWGDPQSMSNGVVKRIIAETDPMLLGGCLSEATVEIYTYPTKEYVETVIVKASD